MDLPVLYTQSDCPGGAAEGARVRAWLRARGVSFAERNVTGDLDAAQALYATGVFATPLLVVAGATVLGYRPAALAAALGG
jgi:hypothetical protein